MIVKLANLYIRALLLLNLLVITVALALHIRVLSGYENSFAKHGGALIGCAFVVAAAVLCLAKERNVWKNEFKACPRWLKITSVALTIYGWMVGLLAVLSDSNRRFFDSSLGASALPLFFASMMPCILYSLIWAAPLDKDELIRRVRISVIGLTVCSAFVLANHFSYLPHSAR